MLFIPVPKKYPSWRHYRIKTNHLMNGCVPRREHCVSWESQCRKFKKKKRVNIWTVSFRREFRLFKMFSLRFLWSCTGQRLVSQMRANFLSFSQKCLSLKHHWNYNCRSHFVHSDRCFKQQLKHCALPGLMERNWTLNGGKSESHVLQIKANIYKSV